MYHDIFQSKKNMISFEGDRYKENGRQIKHYEYILILLKFMHTFLAFNVRLSLVMVMLLNRVPSLLCFHIIIKFCLNR